MKRLLPLFALAGFLCLNAKAQQIKTPAPSPPQYMKQDFGLSAIELSYSRPAVKSRAIFGELVPYGKVWRTGANQATNITFGDDVTINGTKITAGKYGLLTIPGASEWIIIITHQLDVNNPANYKQDQDVLRATVPVTALPFSLENFTIFFNNITANSCVMQLLWDKTMVSLPIQTDIDTKVMAQIDNTLNKDSRPYYVGAMYYMDNGKDLNKALEWLSKAVDQEPKSFFIVYQKARCQAKLGQKQAAIATAKQSIELAKQDNNADYVALNEKLIASLQ
jgi:Protein of unknown function (DUF2911)